MQSVTKCVFRLYLEAPKQTYDYICVCVCVLHYYKNYLTDSSRANVFLLAESFREWSVLPPLLRTTAWFCLSLDMCVSRWGLV